MTKVFAERINDMKNLRKAVSFLLLTALLCSLCLLTGCESKLEKALKAQLNEDGVVSSNVTKGVAGDYIELTDFAVTSVAVNSTEEGTDGTGGKKYGCTLTVKNPYLLVKADCDIHCAADGNVERVYMANSDTWQISPVAGLMGEKISVADLPNSDSIPYGECTVTAVKFNKRKATSLVRVNITADADYVIASGEMQLEFRFENGKWVRVGHSYGKSFSMSWDIGGNWKGDEFKWNKSSTLKLRIEFDIEQIKPNGEVVATVHHRINKNQDDTYKAKGSLDFAEMKLTLNYSNDMGPCEIEVVLEKGIFKGTVIGTADNFRYYNGKFVRE